MRDSSAVCQTRGTVVAVAVSDRRGIQKVPVETVEFVTDWGIKDDAHGGPGIRQVSFLAQESADKARASGLDVKPGDFAENVLTKNLDLRALPLGTRMKVGAATVEITKIGKECHTQCRIGQTMGQCVMPLEGVFCRVVDGGLVRTGDPIDVTYPDEIEPAETARVKREMRRVALDRRRAFSPADSNAAIRLIWNRIETMNCFGRARRIAFYVSSKDNEVDTLGAIDRAIGRGVEVIVPVVEKGTRNMVWSILESRNHLVPSTFGILEPRADRRCPVDPVTADLAIVPLIAFDDECRRIGYGGGFYDTFLASFAGPSLAPAFSVQQLPRIYTEPHDRPVTHVVTEHTVFTNTSSPLEQSAS